MNANVFINSKGDVTAIVDDGRLETLLRDTARAHKARSVRVARVARVLFKDGHWIAVARTGGRRPIRRRFNTRADAIRWEHEYFNLKLGQLC